MERRLHDYLGRWAEERPGADAVVTPFRRMSWAELRAAVDACAAALLAAGVQPGDRVATLSAPGDEFLVTFLATAAVGGIWVGLNPRYADPELAAVVARVEPALVFFPDEIEGRSYRTWAAGLPDSVRTVCFDGTGSRGEREIAFAAFIESGGRISRAAVDARADKVQPGDACLIVFTSGSTGEPKGAVISHRALTGASETQLRAWPAEPLRVLNNLPVNHIGCVGDLACYALVGGGTVVFTPRFDPAASLRAIEAENVTVWGQVPTMFQLTLDAPAIGAARLDSLQMIFWGGAHAAPNLVARLRALCPRVATSWGQTETVGSITFTDPDTTTTPADSVGRVVAPYKLRLVDDEGRELPAGERGEIQVQTPWGMTEYWRDPAATARVILPNGWRRTGDVGELSSSGDLKLVGRVHDVFKSGGYNIYPPEIEEALAAHPGVAECSVVGAPDEVFGSVAVAFFVPEGPPPAADELRAHLRGRIANYKVPKRFTRVDGLPRLPNGKVDKGALRRRAAGS